jgi:hypothetical protein
MIPTQSQFQHMHSGIVRAATKIEGQPTEREIACQTCLDSVRTRKLDLCRRLMRMISHTAFGGEIERSRKSGSKLARVRVPHGDLKPAARIGPAGNGP